MKCLKCKAENPSEAKFCEKCGTKLVKEEKVETTKVKTTSSKTAGVNFKLPAILSTIPKKYLTIAIGAILIIVVAIIGYFNFTNTPQMVVQRYLKAVAKSDLTTALALVVPEERLANKKSLDSFFATVSRFDIQKIKIKDVVISDEEATVDVALDFEVKLKDGQKITYLSSKDTAIIYDGKTKIEVPIKDSDKYSLSQNFFNSIKLEKVKGRWYIINQ